MRSLRRTIPLLSLGLACAVVIALLAIARAHAAPRTAGAVGGAWQTVDGPFFRDQRITALLPDKRRGLWVGAEERGLARWDGNKWQTYGVREGLPDSRVVALFLDREGRLWVSTGSGLGYFPRQGGPFNRIGLDSLRSLPVLAFAEGQAGELLLGERGGLDLWRPDGTIEPVPELDGLEVLALATGRDGTVWVGTSAGAWRRSDGKWQREPALGDGRVTTIVDSADGPLYAAGDTGLWQGQAGAWRRLSVPAKGEMTALAVHNGSVWLGTSQGVLAGQEDVWEVYDPSLLPETRVTTVAWSDDGLLWVGTPSGLVAHLPDPNPPQIAIHSVNGLQPESGKVLLASDRVERIELSARDLLTAESGLAIFTKLEGIDPAPRLLVDSQRQDLSSVTVYAGQTLPPGSYVLRAWAQDEAFNRSVESHVTVAVPHLVRGPAGLAVPQQSVYAGLAGLALVLTAGAATGAAGRTRRRHAEHRAQSAAALVRSAADRSLDFYAVRLPLREAQLDEAMAGLQRHNLLLLAQQGMGKTTTLGQLGHALAAANNRETILAPAGVDLAGIREQELFHALMAAASQALYSFGAGARPRLRWSDAAGTGYDEKAFFADFGLLLAWLQPQLRCRLSLVFLLDNAGVLDGWEGRQGDAFRRLIVAALGADSSLRLVLAAEDLPEVLAGFADVFRTVSLPPLDRDAAGQLLRKGMLGLLEWEPEAERLAINRAAGNPARLAALGRAAAQTALAGHRLRIAASDVP